ncbi:MAG TPA: TetR/AcrR family transcriptional regulator [Paenibacillus sp.]|uniref:TetR/AcrR family transcriptional regulator n=1 Tax=Paenibacillus sp. TaxID=58172 RepID=UPI0028D57E8C|nr:TetR/AcrR family transcriptional regulator [Paenibacillus sp.]HUC92767.1 TetR/AcrR family transcriptional regulator [Paenibacillus sp.]
MPYTTSHKMKVRKKILDSAAHEFRTNGIKEVSVPRLMNGAGLTHGGFYAHFKNKDQLVAEVCSKAIEDTIDRLQQIAMNNGDPAGLQAVVEFYLSDSHRDHPDEGCIIPSLAGEISRSSDDIREVFTEEIRRFISFLTSLGTISRDQGAAFLSTMVGSLLLSRSVSDPDLSRNILSSCKTLITKEILSVQTAK